jgi:hypothetical protein
MIRVMKKTIGILTGASALLIATTSAFAQNVPPISVPITPPAGAIGNNIAVGNIPNFLIQLLFGVGVIAAVIYLIYGGIKWIISGGDKTAVEAARNHIVAAIIGLIIVAAAFFIIQVVFAILGVGNPLTGTFCIPTLNKPHCETQ